MVGVHKTNRNGLLIIVIDVHILLSNIYDHGWDSELPKPVCVDNAASDAETVEVDRKMSVDAAGMLAPCTTMMYASLSHGGHLFRLGSKMVAVAARLKCGPKHLPGAMSCS